MSDFGFNHIFTVRELPVYYLNKYSEIENLANILNQNESILAIDQERAPYNKFYFQKPTLIQISSRNAIYFIDVLDNKEILDPLRWHLTNESITKVFVDAPSDLNYFKEYFKIMIKGIFDIHVANIICNPNSNTTPGLPELVLRELEIKDFKKSKKEQKSDWTIRPLSDSQLKYASNEIAVFLPLYDRLIKKLDQKNLFPFADHGNRRLEIEIPSFDYNPLNVRRIKGFDNLSDSEKHRAMKLGIERDKIAKKRNKPFYFIFSNEQLKKMVVNDNIKPNDVLTRNQRLSKKEMTILTNILTEPLNDSPFEDYTKHINFIDLPILHQKLLIWKNNISKELKIPKRFILSNEEIKSFDFSSRESIMNNVWFSQQTNEICVNLTNSLDYFLKEC